MSLGPPDSSNGSPWARFAREHLYDYPTSAILMWLGGVLVAGTLLLFSLYQVVDHPEAWLPLLIAMVFVGVAGRFAVSVPSAKFAFSTSDAFLFGTLAFLGGPSAVLVAGLDALSTGWGASKRLTSRVFSPGASMIGMTLAWAVFAGLLRAAEHLGLNASAATIGALSVAALVHHAACGTLIEALFSLKRQQPLRWLSWFADSSWMAAASILSALVAALVVVTTRGFGAEAVAISAVCALVIMGLLKLAVRRVESDKSIQAVKLAAAQEEARINQQRFTAAFEHAAGGLALVGGDGSILRVNPVLCALLQREEADLIGEPFLPIVAPKDQAELRQLLAGAAQDAVVAMETRLTRPAGQIWVSLHASRFEDPGASGKGLIFQLHDISDRRAAQEQLQFAAYHDGLTSLPNRLAFLQSLQAAIDRSRADRTATFASLVLDLDRFKMVNDSLGHAAGNDLLVEVAKRLGQSVRPGDFVARLGGDEFGLMFDRISSQEEAVRLGQRVAETVAQPMHIAGSEFTVQCSIGLTLSDLGHRTADEMIRDADIAMYDAKGRGRGRISVFDTPMHDYVADRLHMEAELRRAISAGQITLAYQPILRLEDRRLLGFEALARWQHPELGQVEVPKFIALAEESGFIAQLTPWVIEMAALQMAAWQREFPDGERLKMHVNISARDLELSGFPTSVATALARARLSGHALTLEITETSLMRSMEHALPVMENLRRIGVGFSIDDFGTGYSSLSYLSALPIDSLKIDRSFVLGMERGPQSVEIVRAILRLGQTLHMHVIAEGVETHDNLAALRDIGVESGQGYLFSRPLPAAALMAGLQSQGLKAA